jgi:rod shape determining protein RodA
MNNNRKNFFDRLDWTLIFIIALFCVVSLTAISAAQMSGQYATNFVPKQLFWYFVAACIISVMMYFEPEQYKKMAWYLYGFGIFLLLVLMVTPGKLTEPRNNAKSWFHLGFADIQPSEFMKTFYILALARVVTKHHELHPNKTIKSDFILLGKIALTLIVPLAFILKQPDLGTSLVFLAITAALVLVAGIAWRIILPIGVGAVGIGGTLLWMALYKQEFLNTALGLKPYQFARIYSWLDPYSYSSSDGYHLVQSLNAIGSGQIFGKGYKGHEVYVPENHTDFVFSIIGEEWGFIGCSAVIVLFFFLIYHLTKLTLQMKDPFCTYVCAGIIAMITFHVLENIGMTTQVLPITGIPLPFISYGGSSMMGNAFALGLVFSMKFHHHTYMFGRED